MSVHARLLSPGTIGPMVVRNRIVMPAMDQNLCEDGLLTDANIAHYEQRAEAGVGLLILETSAVQWPVGATSLHQPMLSGDECIPGLTRLADRVHAHGAKMVVQMCHHGKTALVDTASDRPQLVPTVPMPELDMGRFIQDLTMDELMKLAGSTGGKMSSYRQATADDLAGVVESFADAAARVQTAGLDGVEIHAAHGYLLSTFLSPHWNRRDDEYGGSADRRTRLLREVVSAVRARCGGGFAIIVRIDGAEYTVDGGVTPDLAVQHAAAAVEAGADAVHVSAIGSPDNGVSFTDGPLPYKEVQYAELFQTVSRVIKAPVIAVGRITPDAAEQVLADGDADFIAMGRQLLADPQLAKHLIDGRPELVRPCINCMVCVAENFWDSTPVCAVNARLGRPDAPAIEPAGSPRRIAIVGAGPAGLEAARVAAGRGHDVTVFERSDHVGGTARFSAVTTPVNAALVDHLAAAVAAAGVDVRTGTEVTVGSLRAGGFDAVVLATGAHRSRPDLPGADLNHVLTGDDLRSMLTGGDVELRGLSTMQRLAVKAGQRLDLTTPDRVRTLSKQWMPLGQQVVVLGGGLVGVEIAEFLAERGRKVTVLESGPHLGVEMAHPRRWRTLDTARTHGVAFTTDATVSAITEDLVRFRVGEDGEPQEVAADHVIVADHVAAGAPLAAELEAAGIETHVVGDAASVTYIQGAMRTGHDIGATI
jgi:2,4-dienoyl-CoA reductase-like NADH-dependent reductase (Old Yellow Enzyme family)/thioredoxin reductase